MDVDSSMTSLNMAGSASFEQQQQQQSPWPQPPGAFPQPPQPSQVSLSPTPMQQQQQQQHQPIVGLIVPGGPVRTDFVPVDASGTRLTLQLNSSTGDLPFPLTLVNELVVFMPNPAMLPPGRGLLLYWQLRAANGQESGFELLGALVPFTKPSGVFRTGWAEHEQFVALEAAAAAGGGGTMMPTGSASITIGVSVEPMETIQNVTGMDGNALAQPWGRLTGGASNPSSPSNNDSVNNHRPQVAQKIAENLYNFMMSFDTGGASGNQSMVVPANIFDRWWARFEARLKRDPNFFLKDSR